MDYLNRDGADINEALTLQGKVKLTATMETIETALRWLRRMIEDAIGEDSAQSAYYTRVFYHREHFIRKQKGQNDQKNAPPGNPRDAFLVFKKVCERCL